MADALMILVALLAAVAVALLIVLLRRDRSVDFGPILTALQSLERGQERTERAISDEIAQNREEAGLQGRQLREEVQGLVKGIGDSLVKTLAEVAQLQKNQLDAFAKQLGGLSELHGSQSKQLREEVAASVKGFNDSVLKQMGEMAALQKSQLETFSTQLGKLTESNEKKLELLRETVHARLQQIQDESGKKLDQMRATVDEKLQGTLEKRLGESFKLVSERLEQVHSGLGEMKNLAAGVGDLKRVLTNVKTRGTWGEIQLEALLEQVLTPDQYARNVITSETTREVVEFAIKLPGRDDDAQEHVWLPLDAKFPQEDYHRLVEAQERADVEAADSAAKQLELRIRGCAKDIHDKYLNPPKTTDFGIMFLPTEGLYAEVIRRTGLIEMLQRECRVVVAGPTTLAALLNSLQMGFRTLAIQKRSSEVWSLLGAVKTEFGKFGVVLDGVKKKLDQASNNIDDAAKRSRAIERKLRSVQALPATDAQALLPVAEALTMDGTEETD